MDSLTSYLMAEQGELSLDAFTDSMLANLPQQAEGVCSLDPIVPFQTHLNKAQGVPKFRGPGGACPALVPCRVCRNADCGFCTMQTDARLHSLQINGRRTRSCSRLLFPCKSPGMP